jgi:hypothetical protein
MQKNKGGVSDMGLVVIFLLIMLFVWYLAGNTPNPDGTQPVVTTPNDTFTDFGSRISPGLAPVR